MSASVLLHGPRRHPGGPEALEEQPGQLPERAGDVHPRHALPIVIDEVGVVERLRGPGRSVSAAARWPPAPKALPDQGARGLGHLARRRGHRARARSAPRGTRRPRAARPPPRRAPGSRTRPAAGASSRSRASRRRAARRSSVRISSGALPRYSMPSSRKSPDTGIRRSPRGPTRVTCAPSAQRTGAVSDEETAQQRALPGATRQMSPSFFMQKPIARRHSYDWL